MQSVFRCIVVAELEFHCAPWPVALGAGVPLHDGDILCAVGLDAQRVHIVGIQSIQFVNCVSRLLGNRAEELMINGRRRDADAAQHADQLLQPEPLVMCVVGGDLRHLRQLGIQPRPATPFAGEAIVVRQRLEPLQLVRRVVDGHDEAPSDGLELRGSRQGVLHLRAAP